MQFKKTNGTKFISVLMLGLGVCALSNYASSILSSVMMGLTGKGSETTMIEFGTDWKSFVISLLCVGNEGCAWSLLQGHGRALAVFGLAMLAALVWKRRAVFVGDLAGGRLKTSLLAEKLLYAGILGNVVDRLFRGAGIDMFDFQFGSYHYPCFNVADVYICTAVGLLVILSFLPKAKAAA